jgi:uncharacterized protein (TIGR03435 family)
VPLTAGGNGRAVGSSENGLERMNFDHTTMAELIGFLERQMHMPIDDHTNLQGEYSFSLIHLNTTSLPFSEANAPHGPHHELIWDLEAVGLKLVPSKATSYRLVIDHIDRPSAN